MDGNLNVSCSDRGTILPAAVTPQDLEKITDLTVSHYNQHGEDFWEGTRHHNVNQNTATMVETSFSGPPTDESSY